MAIILSVDLSDRQVLVVGGGIVGQRKAQTLAKSAAQIILVDPTPRPLDLPEAWEWRQAHFQEADCDGMALIVAAAPTDVNTCVVAAAKARGLWVLDASEPSRGNVRFPAVGTLGSLTISVDTGSAAPAFARTLTQRWLAELGSDFPAWLTLLKQIRDTLRQQLPDSITRQTIMRELSTWEQWQRFRTDGAEPVLNEVFLRLKQVREQ